MTNKDRIKALESAVMELQMKVRLLESRSMVVFFPAAHWLTWYTPPVPSWTPSFPYIGDAPHISAAPPRVETSHD